MQFSMLYSWFSHTNFLATRQTVLANIVWKWNMTILIFFPINVIAYSLNKNNTHLIVIGLICLTTAAFRNVNFCSSKLIFTLTKNFIFNITFMGLCSLQRKVAFFCAKQKVFPSHCFEVFAQFFTKHFLFLCMCSEKTIKQQTNDNNKINKIL